MALRQIGSDAKARQPLSPVKESQHSTGKESDTSINGINGILVGPPGSGKGTQVEWGKNEECTPQLFCSKWVGAFWLQAPAIAQRYGVCHLATGSSPPSIDWLIDWDF